MRLPYRLAAGVAFCLTLATPAAAQYDSRVYHSRGSWSVELTHNTESGNVWCVAQTQNRRDQIFSVTGYKSGLLTVSVFDPAWKLSPGSVDFRIDVDYKRWDIEGRALDKGITVTLREPDIAARFLGDVMRGSAVALYNRRDTRIGTFSLSGSNASIEKMMECWTRIGGGQTGDRPSDPFR